MSSSIDPSTVVATAEFVLIAIFVVYAAYFALSIRHALFARIYRNQALAVSVGALATGFIELFSYVSYLDSSQFVGPAPSWFVLVAILFLLIFIALFYVIDASARVSRLSDPLLRDTLRWGQTRKVLWTVDLLAFGWVLLTAYVPGFPADSQGGTPAYLVPIFIPLFLESSSSR